MLKKSVINVLTETILLIGIFICSVYGVIAFLKTGTSLSLGFIAIFIFLLSFSAVHVQKLSKNVKKKQATIFLILITLIIATTIYFILPIFPTGKDWIYLLNETGATIIFQ